jgi:hypothetical protein
MSSANSRLEAIKNQVLYSGPATGKEDIARERAQTSFNIEAMKRFWAGGSEDYDILVRFSISGRNNVLCSGSNMTALSSKKLIPSSRMTQN